MGACLRLLEAAVVAAFWALEGCSAFRRVALLLMPQMPGSRAVKIQEESRQGLVSLGA
jgi:hypothetical protein